LPAGGAVSVFWLGTTELAGVPSREARYTNDKLVMKNMVANIPVVRVRKFAEPRLPNKVWEAPLPNAAPISAPLPC
jgi:hypothetical protein